MTTIEGLGRPELIAVRFRLGFEFPRGRVIGMRDLSFHFIPCWGLIVPLRDGKVTAVCGQVFPPCSAEMTDTNGMPCEICTCRVAHLWPPEKTAGSDEVAPAVASAFAPRVLVGSVKSMSVKECSGDSTEGAATRDGDRRTPPAITAMRSEGGCR